MNSNHDLTTKELQRYIEQVYSKAEFIIKKDEIYEPITTHFEFADKGYPDGEYCFSDKEGYHYRCLERGMVIFDKITKDIFDITYWVLNRQFSWLSYQYEKNNRIHGQDNRRLMFYKRIQYFSELGEEYGTKIQSEISQILKKAPYQDSLIETEKLN